MSRMNELDLCIEDMAEGNAKVKIEMVEEIMEHLNGLREFKDLSERSKLAMETWETGKIDEISHNQPHLGWPVDDDDIPLYEQDGMT